MLRVQKVHSNERQAAALDELRFTPKVEQEPRVGCAPSPMTCCRSLPGERPGAVVFRVPRVLY